MRHPDVVVVGSLHLDVMVRAPRLPRLGETAVGQDWWLKEGGKGGNQAVEAVRHGARTAMVGLVGDDDFGRRLRDNLAAHGVGVSAVAIRPGARSGMSVAVVEAAGDYGAIIVSGVNLSLDEAAVAAAWPALSGARVLLLQNEVPEAANLAAASAARGSGALVVLNAAPARPLTPAMAALTDILVTNALEAEALAGVAVADADGAARAAARLLDRVPCAIVTAGADGLAAATRDGAALRVPVHPVSVSGTHGAGDAFVGALGARLAAGEALEPALRYANAAAALVVATPEDARSALGPRMVAALLAAGP